MVILGIGAGLTFPTLSGAAVGSVPGPRFAVATSLNSVARQVGAALGVAILIAILGKPTPPFRPCTRSSTAGCSPAAASWPARWRAWAWSSRARASDARAARRARRRSHARARSSSDRRGGRRRSCRASRNPRVSRRSVAPQTVAEFLRNVPCLRRALGGDARPDRRAGERRQPAPRGVAVPRGRSRGRRVRRAGRPPRGDPGADRSPRRSTRSPGARCSGELALLSDSVRSASIRALRDTELLKIDKAQFDSLLHSEPELALSLDARAERPAAGQPRDPAGAPRAAGDDRHARGRARRSAAGAGRRAQPGDVRVGQGRRAVSGGARHGGRRGGYAHRGRGQRSGGCRALRAADRALRAGPRSGDHGVRLRRATRARARGTSSASSRADRVLAVVDEAGRPGEQLSRRDDWTRPARVRPRRRSACSRARGGLAGWIARPRAGEHVCDLRRRASAVASRAHGAATGRADPSASCSAAAARGHSPTWACSRCCWTPGMLRRPRRRREHGRVHRRPARRRPRQRVDGRLLLRGVGPAQPDQRLHDSRARR